MSETAPILGNTKNKTAMVQTRQVKRRGQHNIHEDHLQTPIRVPILPSSCDADCTDLYSRSLVMIVASAISQPQDEVPCRNQVHFA